MKNLFVLKNLPALGLICLTLSLSACSTKIAGGYVGELRLEGIIDRVVDGVKYGSDEHWTQSSRNAFALVKDEGGKRSVEFSDTDLTTNCRLVEGEPPETCKIDVKGATKYLRVSSVHFTSASALGEGGAMISFEGLTEDGKVITGLFSGTPYEKK